MSEEITADAPVEVKIEPIEVGPGGGVGFDKLDQVEESTVDSISNSVEDSSRNERAQEVAKESIESDGEVTEEAKVKMLKILAGEDELELPSNAVFRKGDQEIQLEDAFNSYIGKQEIDRRFSKLDSEKKDWEQNVKKRFEDDAAFVNGNIKKMLEMSKNGDSWGSIAMMAEMSGQDPVEYQRSMVDQALKVADKFSNMSEPEQRAFWAEQKAKFYEKKISKVEQAKQQTSQEEQGKQQVVEVINQYGIDEKTFAKAYQDLKGAGHLDQLKNLSVPEVAHKVSRYCLDVDLESRVVEAVKAKMGDADPDQQKTMVDKLFKVSEHSYTVDDIKDIISEYQGAATREVATEDETSKGKSSKKPAKPKRANSTEKKDSIEEIEDVLGWDDIPSR